MTDTMTKRAQARRRNILDAAATLVARQGIERCTVDDLIGEADISRATFYRAFGGLDEVIDALYAEYEEHVLTRLAADLDTTTAADDATLVTIVDSVLADLQERGALVRAMFREELRPGAGDISQRRRVTAQVERIHDWWERSTGLPADDDLILCLVLLLQSVGLVFASNPTDSERERWRRSLGFIFKSVVEAYRETATTTV